MNLVSEERDCGCLLGNNTVTKEVFISYCSKHAAAPDLFEALIKILPAALWMDRHGREDYMYWPDRIKMAQAALELADRE